MTAALWFPSQGWVWPDVAALAKSGGGRLDLAGKVVADVPHGLPSDAAGLTTQRYRNRDTDDMQRSVRAAYTHIKDHIKLEGVFQDRVAE